ncbi:hypothetical protein ACTWP5_15645 [Streptomyces sp. 4N509B]|uniref:hypothetical protein n=1 Tax=Streptomyces sp. 4N509B TaxID=3457413 RepID=UPI003FD05E04
MTHRPPHTQNPDESEPLTTPTPCYAESELARATELLTESLAFVAERTGQPLNPLKNRDVLDTHTLAYLLALRHSDNDAVVHERATGLFVRLLQNRGELRELALHAIGAVYAHAPATQPRLRVVDDAEEDAEEDVEGDAEG